MSKISLRDYNHEIEGLINSGKTEEAIAHCKYILRLYPKCVDTYRLLGKAYLEAQRYGEATDILTRILSVVPDDFVSQIGMSIIREDEGNLDAAIYHMERAFEVKPSNSAIQEELRRLYGRRDGITPPRVRLTRGALVRMYTRGELYPQAIAEIRASLAEDPKRVDLEVMLARIYIILGRKTEAIEVCSRLVNKLPNCLEANRILAEVLPGTSRAEDAENYRQRVIALDPYSAYITSNAPTSNEVPDNAIMVDFLDYQPSQQTSQQPEWAKSVGVDLQQTEEAIPDWLVEKPATQGTAQSEATPPPSPLPEVAAPPLSTEQVSAAPPSEPIQAETTEPSEHVGLIPDWMKSAGWTEASSDSIEVKETPALSGEAAEEIAQGELPDWLKAIAPTQEAETPPAESEKEDLAKLDQLLSSQPEETAKTEEVSPVEQATTAEAVGPSQETQPAAEIPASLEEQPASQTPVAAAQPVAQEEVPDWLVGLTLPSDGITAPKEAAAPEAAPTEAALAETVPAEATITEAAPSEAAPAEELPDWLKTLASEAPSEGNVEPVSETSPDKLKDLQANPEPAAAEETPANETLPQAEEPMPDWLKGLGEEITPVPHETVMPAEPESIIPELQPEMTAAPAEAAMPGEPESITPEPQPELTAAPAEAAMPAEPEAITPEPQPEMPAALAEAAVPYEPETIIPEPQPELTTVPAETTQATEPEAKPVEVTVEEPAAKTQPIAVKKIEPPVEEAPAEAVAPVNAQPTVLEPIAAEKTPEDSIDAALAWLESLAAQQGADQETLLVPPEKRTATPPDWIQKEIESAKTTALETPTEAEAAAPAVTESQPVPAAEIEIPPPAAEQSLTAEEIQQPAPVEKIEPPTEAVAPAVEVPVEETSAQEAIPATETGAPKAIPPEEMDLDSAFAWLESLATRQGVEPETLSVPPEKLPEQPPAWVQQAAVEEETKPAAEIPPAVEPIPSEPPSGETSLPAEPVVHAETSEIVPTVSETPAAEIPAEVATGEEPLPDWLKGMETPPIETPPALRAASSESISVWLKNVKVPEEEEAGLVPEPPVEEPPKEPLPEWLQGIEPVITVPTEPLAPAKEHAEELPEWLKEPEPATPEKTATPAEEGLPEWLQGIEAVPETVEPPVIPIEPLAEEITPAIEMPQEQPGEVMTLNEAPALEESLIVELPQEQPPEVLPPVEAPTEAEVLPVGFTIEQPAEKIPAEEPVPVAEVLPQIVAPLDQPETMAELPVAPIEEMPQPAATPSPEELPAEKVPVIAGTDISQVLVEAQGNLNAGDLDQALPKYTELIESKVHLEEIIRDLQNALYRHPVNIALHEVLADAYARSNRLQDALDTYTKAEELLVK
ncbi:MAG: tetratricopeptide repeat protein [Anaerolineaceae bacterium]|jgi:tetratricopeptide (TPR) repeat protein